MFTPAVTPQPPYYAVVFTSIRTTADPEGYGAMAERMVELAQQQPGFLGIDSARGDDGLGITVSYWESEEAIRRWHEQAEHREAQRWAASAGMPRSSRAFCKVERAYDFLGEPIGIQPQMKHRSNTD